MIRARVALGPSPGQNPFEGHCLVAIRREFDWAAVEAMGQRIERRYAFAMQHATAAQAQRNASNLPQHLGAALSPVVGAAQSPCAGAGALVGRGGRSVRRIGRVLGGRFDSGRDDTPGFSTKSVRVFGLQGGAAR